MIALSEETQSPKKLLVVVEGKARLKNHAIGDGRKPATWLERFNTSTAVHGLDKYFSREVEAYEYAFYAGFHTSDPIPAVFFE